MRTIVLLTTLPYVLSAALSAQTLLVPATGSPQQPHFNPAFMARNGVDEIEDNCM